MIKYPFIENNKHFLCIGVIHNENWIDIDGYKELYKVSNLGRVLSMTKSVKGNWGKQIVRKEKLLKSNINRGGYAYVVLCKNNTQKTFTIHKLVALAFIPNVENKKQVNHKDCDKQNNNVLNLEWNTAKENMNHAHLMGVMNMPKRGNHPQAKLVINVITNKKYKCIKDAFNDYNIGSLCYFRQMLAGAYPNTTDFIYA